MQTRSRLNTAGDSTRPQRGVALITVLMVLLILTAIAFGLMYMANTETMINSNFRSVRQAYAASRAGLEEARERLMMANAPPHGIAGPLVLPGAGNSILYLINPKPGENVNPTLAGPFLDDELCQENFIGLGPMASPPEGQPCAMGPPPGPIAPFILSDVPLPFSGSQAALDYKWVRITAKANNTACIDPVCTGAASHAVVSPGADNTRPVCWDGSHQLLLPAGYATCLSPAPAGLTALYRPVFVLTSLAVGRDGTSRMTQMEVAEMPPIMTNAALDTQDLVATGGASVTVNGFDNCKCSCTVGKGGGAPVCTNRSTGATCTGDTYAIYTTQSVTGNGVTVAGTNPVVAEHQTNFPWDVNALANAYTSATGAKFATSAPYNLTCTAGNCGSLQNGTFGNLPNPFPPTAQLTQGQLAPGEVDQVTIIPGSVDLQAKGSGSGVLVVQGDLTIHGGMEFYGLVIVTGRLYISGGGQGQGANIIGGIIAGQGTSTDTIGGSVNLQFDSCALGHNHINQPPSIVAFRELPY